MSVMLKWELRSQQSVAISNAEHNIVLSAYVPAYLSDQSNHHTSHAMNFTENCLIIRRRFGVFVGVAMAWHQAAVSPSTILMYQ